MKSACLALLMLLLFITAAKAQEVEFPHESNTLIIVDDSLKMSDFAHLLLKSGYLFTQRDSLVIVTDFNWLKSRQISFICNKIDTAFYIRATYKSYDGNYGEVHAQIRYVFGFRKDFEEIYHLFNAIKPNLTIKAVKL